MSGFAKGDSDDGMANALKQRLETFERQCRLHFSGEKPLSNADFEKLCKEMAQFSTPNAVNTMVERFKTGTRPFSQGR